MSRFLVLLTLYSLHGADLWTVLQSRWDAEHYVALAQDGYPTILPRAGDDASLRWAFFPLFPALVHVLSAVTGVSTGAMAILLNLLLGLAAVLALQSWLRRYLSAPEALLGVAFLSFWPQSYFFTYAYSEPLYLLILCGVLLALPSGSAPLLGLLGILLGLSRPTGLIASAGLVAGTLWERRRGAWRTWLGPLCLGAGVVVGNAGFSWGYCAERTGSLANCHLQAEILGWGFGTSFLPWAWVQDWIRLLQRPDSGMYVYVRSWELLSAAMVVPLSVWAFRRRAAMGGAGVAFLMAVPVISQLSVWTLRSTPRFMSVTPVLFFLLGTWMRKPALAGAMLLLCFVLQLVSHTATAMGVWQSF